MTNRTKVHKRGISHEGEKAGIRAPGRDWKGYSKAGLEIKLIDVEDLLLGKVKI